MRLYYTLRSVNKTTTGWLAVAHQIKPDRMCDQLSFDYNEVVHFAGRWKPDGEEIKTSYEAVYIYIL